MFKKLNYSSFFIVKMSKFLGRSFTTLEKVLLAYSASTTCYSISQQVLDIKKELGETNVDIEAYAKLLFSDSFFSQIGTSFKNQLGGTSEILGDKGSIKINSSWFGGDKIIKNIKGNNYVIDSNTNKNIYSYQIENISKNLSLNIFS